MYLKAVRQSRVVRLSGLMPSQCEGSKRRECSSGQNSAVKAPRAASMTRSFARSPRATRIIFSLSKTSLAWCKIPALLVDAAAWLSAVQTGQGQDVVWRERSLRSSLCVAMPSNRASHPQPMGRRQPARLTPTLGLAALRGHLEPRRPHPVRQPHGQRLQLAPGRNLRSSPASKNRTAPAS